MKILHAIPSLKVGGAERIVANLTTALSRKGHDVSVLLYEPMSDGCFQVDQQRVRVKVINSFLSFKYSILSVIKVLRFLKKERFDVIHTHLTVNNTVVRFLAVLAGTPVVVGHEHGSIMRRNRLAKLLMQHLEKKISYNLYISDHDLKYYTTYDKSAEVSKHIVVPNPVLVDVKPFNYDNNRKVQVIGMVGRIIDFKGHLWALKAMSSFLKNNDCKLVIVGDGDSKLRQELLDYAGKNGIDLEITGYIQNVEDYYSRFDVLVHPSFAEGFGLAIIEAMAFGVPVIASNVGGIPNIIENGCNGLLFQPGNEAELLEKLEQVNDDSVLKKSLSKQGCLTVVEKYSFDKYVTTIERLYEDAFQRVQNQKINVC